MEGPDQQPNAEFAKDSQSSQRLSEHEISEGVIGCAIEVQRHLGVGLLESAYAAALAIELRSRNLRFVIEAPVLGHYKGIPLGTVYRADFIVEGRVIVELKAVEAIAEAHRAQVLSYLRVSGLRLGLLINFHAAPLAARGVSRIVNQL